MAPQGNRGAGALYRRTRWPESSPAARGGKSEVDRRDKHSRASPSPRREGLLVAVVIVVLCVLCFLSETAEHCLRFPTFGF